MLHPCEGGAGVALLAEGVDRNQTITVDNGSEFASPSSRRAWIEICFLRSPCVPSRVALLAEGVDRNLSESRSSRVSEVALLAEGVDRNATLGGHLFVAMVALLAEGVDRNGCLLKKSVSVNGRPPRGGRG